MKHIFSAIAVFVVLVITAVPAFAQVHVRGYTRADGTVVQPYTRSASDNTVTNNYSFEGNTNPYSGTAGTNSYPHDVTSPHFDGTPDGNGHIGHSNQGLLKTTTDTSGQ